MNHLAPLLPGDLPKPFAAQLRRGGLPALAGCGIQPFILANKNPRRVKLNRLAWPEQTVKVSKC